MAALPDGARELLGLIVSHGGTRRDLYDVKMRYKMAHPTGDHFSTSMQALTRLNLAFVFHG